MTTRYTVQHEDRTTTPPTWGAPVTFGTQREVTRFLTNFAGEDDYMYHVTAWDGEEILSMMTGDDWLAHHDDLMNKFACSRCGAASWRDYARADPPSGCHYCGGTLAAAEGGAPAMTSTITTLEVVALWDTGERRHYFVFDADGGYEAERLPRDAGEARQFLDDCRARSVMTFATPRVVEQMLTNRLQDYTERTLTEGGAQ